MSELKLRPPKEADQAGSRFRVCLCGPTLHIGDGDERFLSARPAHRLRTACVKSEERDAPLGMAAGKKRETAGPSPARGMTGVTAAWRSSCVPVDRQESREIQS